MGWVQDRFREQAAVAKYLPILWAQMRDSIGIAVEEFNQGTAGTVDGASAVDCRAMGRFCRRVTKTTGQILEVYLDEPNHLLKTAAEQGADEVVVCAYRWSAERGGMEFVRESEGVPAEPMSAERACELALSPFLFPTAR